MKRFLIPAFLVPALLLGGCEQAEKNIDLNAVKESIVSEIALESPHVTYIGGNKDAAERFGIPLNKVQEGFVYANDKNADKADEIIVIKAKNKRDVNEIERALEAEITGLSNAWEGTDKTEYEKVQQHILRSKGKYVLLAIGEQNKKAEEIFNGFFT